MKIQYIFLTALMMVGMVACKPKPASDSQSSANVSRNDGSVYDDGYSSSNGGIESEDIESDPLQYDTGSIDSQRLDLDDAERANEQVDWNWDPIFFEFDRSELSESAKATLKKYGSMLKANPNVKVLLEGHCDRRGTETYNLGLGERRAESVRRYLMDLGIAPARLRTISYGELQPLIIAENESAWAKNRRVSFTF